MFKTIFGKLAIALAVALLGAATIWAIAPHLAQAAGQGTLPEKRKFSFSAQQSADGSVKGNAVLHNPAFTGANGQKYQLQIDIVCMKVYPDNIAVFGGWTRRTNDPNLVDAVFFSIQDNGNPGTNDKLSRAYFWDDDPDTTGDPMACELTGPNDLPLETIESGNINLKTN